MPVKPPRFFKANQKISSHVRRVVGSLGFGSGVLSLMLPNAVSLLLYIWASVCLAQVRVGLAFKWMYAPWMMFGMCAQIFGLISHVVDETSLRMPSHRPPLSKVFVQTEKALMWLQVDVGFALFACSDWIMIHPSPLRMLITIFIISILPLIAWASEHPKGAIGLTQMSSILHTMACLHVKLLVLDFWGVLSSSLMFTYLLLISLPQDYILLGTLRLETINIIFPALLSRAIVKGFAELSQLQIT